MFCYRIEEFKVTDASPMLLLLIVRQYLMKFNKAKSKVLHLSQGNHKHKCRLCEEWIQNSPEGKDLGVLADEKLSMT